MAGVFHSLSAVTAVMHTLEMGRRDPLVLGYSASTRDGHPPAGGPQISNEREIAARARRRTERYKSPRDLAKLFAHVPQFKNPRPEAYELMARATLSGPTTPRAIRCSPARASFEAHVFESNLATRRTRPRMKILPVPCKLIRGYFASEHKQPPALIGRAIA